MIGIYIHIPFCKGKCPYCDFYSLKADESKKDSYLKAVLFEIEKWKSKVTDPVDTIYFGGGTPSVFGAERIKKTIDCIKDNYILVSPQITVECNASSTDEKFFKALSSAGVNRISMGLQSAAEKERKILGRHADKNTVSSAIENAKKAGITDISLDLMLGVPYQTIASLDESIDFLLNAGITHISAYMLKIEEGTPFAERQDSLTLPDEDEVCDMYFHTVKRLREKGFAQYEISNFSLKGYESRHNLKYWHCEEYLGIGPSAHSFLDGKRFYYPRDLVAFISGTEVIPDGDGGSEEEYIMLNLRLTEGLKFEKFKSRFSRFPDPAFTEKAVKFEKMGFLKIDDEGIRLTERGFLLSNTIIAELL